MKYIVLCLVSALLSINSFALAAEKVAAPAAAEMPADKKDEHHEEKK